METNFSFLQRSERKLGVIIKREPCREVSERLMRGRSGAPWGRIARCVDWIRIYTSQPQRSGLLVFVLCVKNPLRLKIKKYDNTPFVPLLTPNGKHVNNFSLGTH